LRIANTYKYIYVAITYTPRANPVICVNIGRLIILLYDYNQATI